MKSKKYDTHDVFQEKLEKYSKVFRIFLANGYPIFVKAVQIVTFYIATGIENQKYSVIYYYDTD